MALNGKTNEEKIWNYLKSKGLNDYGCAGLMGNLYAESGLKSNNLQNTYEKKIGYTDAQYVKAVDDGSYTNFIKDSAGFGICQWTFHSRKKALYDYAKSKNKSIGNLEMQLQFLYKELSENYKSILSTLKTATSILDASNEVLLKFERPADQSVSVQKKRASYGQVYYDKYADKKKTQDVKEDFSINITKKTSTHNTSYLVGRPHEFIVLHYTAGTTSKTGTAINIANYFATVNKDVSADFIVDDGTIVQYNPNLNNRYCWAVGGDKYSSMTTSLGGKYHKKCVHKNSINIEMCSNKTNKKSLDVNDTDWYLTDATVNNAVILVRYLMKKYNIDINHVIMHHHVTGKVCPQPWTINEKALVHWENFLKKVKGETVVAHQINTQSATTNISSNKNTTSVATNKEKENKTIKIEKAKYFSKSLSGSYKTTENLNLRSGADLSKEIITVIPKGSTVRCYGYYNKTGNLKWYYITYENKEKIKYVGFASSIYLRR